MKSTGKVNHIPEGNDYFEVGVFIARLNAR